MKNFVIEPFFCPFVFDDSSEVDEEEYDEEA